MNLARSRPASPCATRPFARPACSTLFLFLLVATAMAATMLRSLVTEGMFFDGLTYATLARNMAQGLGSFWSPYFSPAWEGFHEHPPLGIALLAGAYRLLGTSVYVEKAYGVALAVLDAFLIGALWRRFRRQDPLWPILLWITIPVVSWAYRNNMLEAPQTTFLLVSTLALVTALRRPASDGRAWLVLRTAIAGTGVACALLVKGPVGLLPLAVPFLYWMVFRSRSLAGVAGMTLLVVAFAGLAMGATLLDPAASGGYAEYFRTQLVGTFAGARPMTSRLVVLGALASELGPAVGVTALLVIGVRRQAGPGHAEPAAVRPALFFLLTGLAGTLPILLSPRQSRFYVVPSLPFFALGIGLFCAGEVRFLLSKVGTRSVAAATVALLAVAGVALRHAGGVGRDPELVSFAKEASALFPAGTMLAACPSVDVNYPLASYLARYGGIGVSSLARDARLLVSDGTCPDRQRGYPTQVLARDGLAVFRR